MPVLLEFSSPTHLVWRPAAQGATWEDAAIAAAEAFGRGSSKRTPKAVLRYELNGERHYAVFRDVNGARQRPAHIIVREIKS